MLITIACLLGMLFVLPVLLYKIGYGHGRLSTFEVWMPRVAHARKAHMHDLHRLATSSLANRDLATYDVAWAALEAVPSDMNVEQHIPERKNDGPAVV